jgi:hypothetical protein
MSSPVSSRLRQHGKKNNKQRGKPPAASRLQPGSSSKVRRGIKQPGAAGSSRLLQRSSQKKK